MRWTRRRGVSLQTAAVLLAVASIHVAVPQAEAVSLGAAVRVAGELHQVLLTSDDLNFIFTASPTPGSMIRTNRQTGAQHSFNPPSGYRFATGDGENLVFQTTDRLASGDTDNAPDSYFYRIVDGSTRLIGGSIPRGTSPAASSFDGRVVALEATVFGSVQLWRIDGLLGTATELVSLVPDDKSFSYGVSWVSISADGRYTAFVIGSGGSGDPLFARCTACEHAYVYDAVTGSVELVDRGAGGRASNGNVTRLQLSADGRHILFGSTATDLIAPASPQPALWVRDLDTSVVQRVSPTGVTTGYISGDGRRVVYDSDPRANEKNSFVFDRADVDPDSAATPLATALVGYFISFGARLAVDGRSVVFEAPSDVAGDGKGPGSFRRTLPTAAPIPNLSAPTPPSPPTPAPALVPLTRIDGPDRRLLGASGDGRYVLTTSAPTGIIRRIDTTTGNAEAVDLPLANWSKVFALSFDGSEMIFESGYPLTPDDTTIPAGASGQDLYAYRFGTHSLRLLTGGIAPNLSGFPGPSAATSANGRYLVADTTTNSSRVNYDDAYWFDTLTKAGVRLTDTVDGATKSSTPSMSADGRYVAFLVYNNVYVFDATTRTSRLVDRALPADGPYGKPMISADGRWVVVSRTIHIPGTMGGTVTPGEVYVTRVDGSTGRRAVAPVGYQPAISSDGALVAFLRGPATRPEMIVADLSSGAPTPPMRIVNAPTGVTPNQASGGMILATDGSSVFFTSAATNLAPNDSLVDEEVYGVTVGPHVALPPTLDPTPRPPGAASGQYTPLAPTRLLDTRVGGTTIDARFAGIGTQRPGTRLELPITGRAGIASGATAAVLNVTVTGSAGDGYLTAWPCDTAAPPNASNLNFAGGQTIPNLVIAPLSPAGTVCLQTSESATHVLVDVNGYFPAGTAYTAVAPKRVLDTRSGGQTTDARHAGAGLQPPGTRLELPITGRAGVPNGATAVVLNITVTGPAGDGYLTAWPCDTVQPPNASNLNYVAGQTIPNLVIAPLSPTGTVCLQTTEAATHILADINGYYPAGSTYTSLTPKRVLDTRPGGTTIDSKYAGAGLQQPGARLELQVTGRAGVPSGASAAVLNVTVTSPTGDGYLTVWPCDTIAPPNASNLNYVAGQTIPNLVIAPLSPTGTVCLQTSESAAHILADINGYESA